MPPPEFDPDSLGASHSRRPNAGVPRKPFDAVNELVEKRTKIANKDAKASAAAEIEADLLAGDDSPEREALGKFIPPICTGDDDIDQPAYDRARIEYLVPFIAKRDGIDVRPAVQSGKMDIADLEEIYADPEAAAEELANVGYTPHLTNKGKQKAANETNHQDEDGDEDLLGQTGYTGITIDENDYIIKPKHAPKNKTSTQQRASGATKRGAEQDETPRKSRRGAVGASQTQSGLKIGSTGGSGAHPLSRTDSTTLIDGQQLAHPNFSRAAANSASSATRNSGGMGTKSNGSHNSKSSSTPARPNAKPTNSHPSGTQLHTAPKTQVTQRIAPPATQATSGCGRQAAVAPTAGPMQPKTHGPSRQLAPIEDPQSAPQNLNRNAPQAAEDEDELDEPEDEEVDDDGLTKKRKTGGGKAYINTFPKDQQALITTMVRIARAHIIANGTYDDNSEQVVDSKYPNWPADWPRRVSRQTIVMESLKKACKEHDMDIPFSPRHLQSVNMMITTHRTLASKAVVTLVERFFKFTIEPSERNQKMSEKLLPCNYHYKNIPNKRGPFENVLLKYACQLVAFDSLSSIGAKYSEYFDTMPPPFIAYVCALIHFVAFSYRNGHFQRDDLSVGVQTSAFRRALRFMISTQENKPNSMFSVQNIIYDHCMDALGPKDDIRDPSPEPERDWSPDRTEPYISRYAGNNQNFGSGVRGDNDDVEMGDLDRDELGDD
ncbi:hypothetical protein FRC09_001036 [Ceratobasidium sp. 395]|nr:hypothetical protein FRC09_001036 [Ceratobasidium sp. 395]